MVSQDEKDEALVLRKRFLILSIILLAFLAMTLAGLVSSYLEYRHFSESQSQQEAANQAAQNRQQQAQENQSKAEQAKLCSTLKGLAALKAPSGSPANNPSRAFEQAQQAKLSELKTDIGC